MNKGLAMMSRRLLLLCFLFGFCLVACGGGNAEETAVAPTPKLTNTPAGNETAVAIPTEPPLSMETIVAQTRTAEQTNRPSRINHMGGFQLDLPVGWELSFGNSFIYLGTNGSFRASLHSRDNLTTLAEMCASDEVAIELNYAGNEREMTEINGREVCLMKNVGRGTVPYAMVAFPTPRKFIFPDENGNVGPFEYMLLYSSSPTVTVLQVLETLEFPQTPDAAAYLRGLVDEYQANYVFRDQVDFVAWEAEVLTRLTPDSPLEEAHQLIFEMFDMMRAATQHDHLAYYSPERLESVVLSPARPRLGMMPDSDGMVWLVEPGSPAETAGMQIGDKLLTINGMVGANTVDGLNEVEFERDGQVITVSIPLEFFSNLRPPDGRSLTDNIAYLETLGFNNQIDAELSRYITLVHDQIAVLDAPDRCWVLDLRRNQGGSKHAIQGGIGPFAGNGPLYNEWLDDFNSYPVMYENGRVYSDYFPNRNIAPERPYTMMDTGHRIAILVSERTASGGELATLIVGTQPENSARIFGEPTVGFSSSVRFVELYDKSMVQLPSTAWMDLDGNLYPQGMIPDEPIDVIFDAAYGTLDDPVVQAAVAWLEKEQGCQ